jgi:hypothetical protein
MKESYKIFKEQLWHVYYLAGCQLAMTHLMPFSMMIISICGRLFSLIDMVSLGEDENPAGIKELDAESLREAAAAEGMIRGSVAEVCRIRLKGHDETRNV